jgi:uncharacterized repeat protein (TIGR01451 family)
MVGLSINHSPLQTVTAAQVSTVTTPAGAPGFQAFADVTAALRPFGGQSSASTVSVSVSGLPVATGPGCAGGWNLLVVYGFPGGPDKTYAPIYQRVAVYDPVLVSGGTAGLTGLVTPSAGPVGSGVTTSLLTAGTPVSVTLNGRPIAVTTTGSGTGYQPSATPLPTGTFAAGANTAAVGASGGGDSFAALVFAVGIALPVTVSLPVTAAFTPTTVATGSVAQLTLTVRNGGNVADPGVAVTAALPTGVSVVDDNPAYNSDSGVWSVGTVAAQTTATLTLIVRVNQAGTFSSSAQVTASAFGLGQSPPTASTATITARTVAIPLPTGGEGDGGTQPATLAQPGSSSLDLPPGGVIFGIGLFALGLVLLLVVLVRRRSPSP